LTSSDENFLYRASCEKDGDGDSVRENAKPIQIKQILLIWSPLYFSTDLDPGHRVSDLSWIVVLLKDVSLLPFAEEVAEEVIDALNDSCAVNTNPEGQPLISSRRSEDYAVAIRG
jgi:hypothetical protein